MDQDAIFQAHHGFFDLEYTRSTAKGLARAGDKKLIKLLLDPENASPPAPNCIFDVQHYNLIRARHGLGAPLNPIVHYLEHGAAMGLGINALFDEAFYRRHAKLSNVSSAAVVAHALEHMSDGLCPFSPFVDVGFICATINRPPDADVLRDLFTGVLQPKNPHPLVDIAFMDAHSHMRIDTLQDALRHYWQAGEDIATHPLFDVAYYKDQFPETAEIERSVYHYLVSPDPLSPHALFEPEFYSKQAIAELGRAPSRLFEHFISTGQSLGLMPSPFFDTAFYRDRSESGPDALQHYLNGGHRHHAPHPMVDADNARLLGQSAKQAAKTTAQLLAENTADVPMAVTPEFDPISYRKTLENAGTDPALLRHRYFREGYPQGVRPNGLLSLTYIDTQCHRFGVSSPTAIAAYFEQRWHRRRRILVVLSSMNETPINRGWYALCKSQLDNPDVEFIVVSVSSGPMSERFFKVAHVWHLAHRPLGDADPNVLAQSAGKLAQVLASNPAEVAFVDCSMGLALLEAVTVLGARQIAFGDAGLSQVPEERLDVLSRSVDRVLCQSADVKSALEEKSDALNIISGIYMPIAANRTSDAQRSEARHALGISEDDILIVSSGGPEIEHGVDLFGALAAQCFEDDAFGSNTIFHWQGPGKLWGNCAGFYGRHFADTVPNDSQFRMSDDPDRTTALRAADIYVKLGRDRCGPGDVMQAIVAGLPVVVMKGPDDIATLEQAGAVRSVDPFDLVAMRQILRDLTNDPQKREELRAQMQSAVHDAFGIEACVSCVNDAIQECVPGLTLLPPSSTIKGQLFLVLSDESAMKDLSEIAESSGSVGNAPALWLNHHQAGDPLCPPAIKAAITRSACAEIAVISSDHIMRVKDISAFDTSYFLARGIAAELTTLFVRGLEFDEIFTPNPEQIAQMHRLNPRIADTMTALEGSTS